MSHRSVRHAALAAQREEWAARLVDDYIAGASVAGLAELHGISRGLVTRVLSEAGVDLRDRSGAMRQRLSELTFEQRRELASAAHAARREQGATNRELARRAGTAEVQAHLAALGEAELTAMLRDRGLNPLSQRAEGSHNIDLALPPVAVEVHRRTSHPFRLSDDRLTERARQLFGAGWLVLYVWCAQGVRTGPGMVCFTDRCADEVADHVRRARADRSSVPPVRVLRCTGEDAHSATATGTGRGRNRPDFFDL